MSQIRQEPETPGVRSLKRAEQHPEIRWFCSMLQAEKKQEER